MLVAAWCLLIAACCLPMLAAGVDRQPSQPEPEVFRVARRFQERGGLNSSAASDRCAGVCMCVCVCVQVCVQVRACTESYSYCWPIGGEGERAREVGASGRLEKSLSRKEGGREEERYEEGERCKALLTAGAMRWGRGSTGDLSFFFFFFFFVFFIFLYCLF